MEQSGTNSYKKQDEQGEIDPQWLQTLYEEAWRQYDHEDVMSQNRNNVFLGVETALIAFIVGLSGFLVRVEPGQIFPFGAPLLLFCVLVIYLAILGRRLASSWEKANTAGRAFLNLRWVTTRAIEEQVKLRINLAGMEHSWRKFSQDHNQGEPYVPFRVGTDLGSIPIAEKLREIIEFMHNKRSPVASGRFER